MFVSLVNIVYQNITTIPKREFIFLYRILSEDDLHLFEIPEPPTIISKNDNRSSIGSGSAILCDTKVSSAKMSDPNKVPQQQYHQCGHSSIIFESDQDLNRQVHISRANADEDKSCNNLKNIIHKLEIVS